MKKSILILGCAFFALASCSSPTSSSSGSNTSTYTNSTLPQTLAVKTPASLSTSTTARAVLSRSAAARTASGTTQSEGYFEITAMTTILQGMAPLAVMFGVIVDAAISQNNLKPGTDTKNVKVTLTQAMFNTIAAQLPASETSTASSEIGTSMPLDDVNYAATGTGTLPNSVSITASGLTITYKWDSKNDVQIGMTMGTDTMTMTYSGTDGSGAIKVVGSTGTFQISMAPDASSTANGVSTAFSMSNGSFTYTVYGYADDNGGTVYTTVAANGSNSYWAEGFDGTGSLVYQVTASTLAGLATATDTYSVSSTTEASNKASYATKAAGAATLSCGATTLLTA